MYINGNCYRRLVNQFSLLSMSDKMPTIYVGLVCIRQPIHGKVWKRCYDRKVQKLETMIDQQQERKGVKRSHDQVSDEEDDQAHDEVRLWEDGFKDRYYESKFDIPADNLEFRCA